MRLKDGSDFPKDFLPVDVPSAANDRPGTRRYRTPSGAIGRWVYVQAAGRWRTECLEHDPAYLAITHALGLYDLRETQDRHDFLALLAAASFLDAWGYVQETSSRVAGFLNSLEKWADVEQFSTRLDAIERKQAEIQAAIDDAVLAVEDARGRSVAEMEVAE